MWDGMDFSGTKIALLQGERLITYLRDDTPDIPYPGMWDLPGGGREGDEDPVECALREVEEEFGLSLSTDRVLYMRRRPSRSSGRPANYFCVAKVLDDEVASIRFGNEGQRWAMMTVRNFLDHPQAVPDLKLQLCVYFDGRLESAAVTGSASGLPM